MSKYELRTQVLTPEEEKAISFSGAHPSRFFGIMPGLIKKHFEVTSSKFFEDKIKWDIGDKSVQFFAVWRGRLPKDGRTNIWAQVKLQGVQNLDKEKMGEAVIFLSGTVLTKFNYLTILDKALYRSYTYLYYNNIRRKYLEEARRRLTRLENDIKEEIGVPTDQYVPR